MQDNNFKLWSQPKGKFMEFTCPFCKQNKTNQKPVIRILLKLKSQVNIMNLKVGNFYFKQSPKFYFKMNN